MQSIDSAILNAPTVGVNLRPGPLREQLSSTRTLLVFLRHFG